MVCGVTLNLNRGATLTTATATPMSHVSKRMIASLASPTYGVDDGGAEDEGSGDDVDWSADGDPFNRSRNCLPVLK